MNDSIRQRWPGWAMLASTLYAAIGVLSGELAAAAASSRMVSFWRASAFVLCGVVFAAHVAQEHYRLRSTRLATAWRVSLAVAVGGFALAVAANLHDLGSAAGYRPRMLVALVAWPLLTAVPAFIAALAIAAALGASRRRG